MATRDDEGLHPGWWTLILLLLLVAAIWLTYALFTGTLKSTVPVTLTSDRCGSGDGDQRQGQAARRAGRPRRRDRRGTEPVALRLEIDPDQLQYIPANVEAQIRATTIFGAKFVDLVYPEQPHPQRLEAGQVWSHAM